MMVVYCFEGWSKLLRALRSLVTHRPRASLAVEDASADSHHAIHGWVIRGCHLDGPSALEAPDDLNAGDGPLHARAKGAGGEVGI